MPQEGPKQSLDHPVYLVGAALLFVLVGLLGALVLSYDTGPRLAGAAPKEFEVIRTYGPEVHPKPEEPEPEPPPVYEPAPVDEYNLGLTQATLDGILAELEQLRNRVAKVEHDNSVLLNTVVGDIKEQNKRLLQEIQRLYAMMPENREYAPPDFRDLPGEGSAEVRQPRTISAVATQGGGTVKYRILRQWGRTPEEAANNPDVSSVINLIGLVTPGAPMPALRTMAKEIAAQYASYDAMDISLFDDENAAEAFYSQNAEPGPHRVIAVTKLRGNPDPAIRVWPSAPQPAPVAAGEDTQTPEAEEPPTPQPDSPDNS